MAKKDRLFMPQSTAGLIRYFDESQEAIRIKPIHVVGIIIAIIVLEIALKLMLFI